MILLASSIAVISQLYSPLIFCFARKYGAYFLVWELLPSIPGGLGFYNAPAYTIVPEINPKM